MSKTNIDALKEHCAELNENRKELQKNNQKCPFDPKKVEGPIGMFHCPVCGEMQIAGMSHISLDDLYDDDYNQAKEEKC